MTTQKSLGIFSFPKYVLRQQIAEQEQQTHIKGCFSTQKRKLSFGQKAVEAFLTEKWEQIIIAEMLSLKRRLYLLLNMRCDKRPQKTTTTMTTIRRDSSGRRS